MNTIHKTIAVSAFIATTAQGAWTWQTFTSEQGTDVNLELIPTGATYDPTNAVDGNAWDRTPEPLSVSFTADQAIEISLNTNGYWLDFDLDADGDGVFAENVSITFTMSYGLTYRGISSDGALGGAINNMGGSFNVSMSASDADGDDLDLTNSSLLFDVGSSRVSGDVVWDTIAGRDLFYGLDGGNPNPTDFPFNTTDPSKVIGSQTFTISNISDTEAFRFSFDGGVGADSPAVPEPSGIILLGLGSIALLRRIR